jgi:hypothetical protein
MLRIQLEDVDSQTTVLRLDGDIFGDWSDLLESECLNALRAGRCVVLDLTGVPFVALSGICVLRRLGSAGVRISNVPLLLADVLEHEGIAVERAAVSMNATPAHRDQEPH